MEMQHHGGHPGVAEYVGMWMLMMVPMMLPSLVPMLLRYCRSVQGAGGMHLHGLTVVVGAGYYAVWAVIGVAVWAVSAGVVAVEMKWGWVGEWKPIATAVVLLVAGAIQFSSWKARQLAIWRAGPVRGGMPAATASGAWRDGARLGVRCSLGCGNLMLALLAIGMMNMVAMVAVTLAIFAERLAPAPLRVSRVVGMAIVAIGVLTDACV